MSKTQKPERIVVATDEDVRKYGGEGTGAAPESSRAPMPGPAAGPEEAQAPGGVPDPPDEMAALKDKLLRARAELSNALRRAENEKAEAVRFAVADFARDLLNVVDDFERMLQAADGRGGEGLIEAVTLIHKKLMKTLADHHVERIEALGQPFEPAYHEAVMQQSSKDHPPQTVIQELRPGFRLYDRLLRPSQVVVSATPGDAAQAKDAEGPAPDQEASEEIGDADV